MDLVHDMYVLIKDNRIRSVGPRLSEWVPTPFVENYANPSTDWHGWYCIGGNSPDTIPVSGLGVDRRRSLRRRFFWQLRAGVRVYI